MEHLKVFIFILVFCGIYYLHGIYRIGRKAKKLAAKNKVEADAEKKKADDAKAEELNFLKKWSWHWYIPEYKHVYVFYLNPAHQIIKMKLNDFLKLSVPESDYPKTWIVCLSVGDVLSELDHLFLVSDETNWRFDSYTKVSKTYFRLKDGDEYYPFVIDAPIYEEAINAVLIFVKTYKNAALAWIGQFQKYACPIIIATKSSMGESVNLYMLRLRIEAGLQPYSTINNLFPIDKAS